MEEEQVKAYNNILADFENINSISSLSNSDGESLRLAATLSIAISLKRIADILTPTHDIMMTPEELAVHKKSFE